MDRKIEFPKLMKARDESYDLIILATSQEGDWIEGKVVRSSYYSRGLYSKGWSAHHLIDCKINNKKPVTI